MERDFAMDDGFAMQCEDDVLLSCTLETCMILWTNVTPINSIKKEKETNLAYPGPLGDWQHKLCPFKIKENKPEIGKDLLLKKEK